MVFIPFLFLQLSPSDGDIIESHKREVLEAKNYARKMSVVVLSDKKDEDKDKKDDEKLDQVRRFFYSKLRSIHVVK